MNTLDNNNCKEYALNIWTFDASALSLLEFPGSFKSLSNSKCVFKWVHSELTL